jgi:hypothetical protein
MSKSVGLSILLKNTSVHGNAYKIKSTLEGLSQIDDRLSNWYLSDKPKKNSILESITNNDLDFFENLVIRRRNKNPDTKEIFIELGSNILLKSHKTFTKGFGLWFTCCTDSKDFHDGVLFYDPLLQKEMDLTDEQIQQIVMLFKEIWQPDTVEVC